MPLGTENIGTLEQAILNAQNELSRLLNSGLSQTALSVIKQKGIVQAAKQALQAATGSQQGMGLGGGMAAFGLPNYAMGIETPSLSKGGGQGFQMNEGPLGQLMAQFLPSLFGQQSPLARPLAEPGTGTASLGSFSSPTQIPSSFPSPYGRTGPFLPLPEKTTPGGRTTSPTTNMNPESRFLPIGARRPAVTKQPKQTKNKKYKAV